MSPGSRFSGFAGTGGGGGPVVEADLTGTSGSQDGDNTAVAGIISDWGIALGYGFSATPPSNGAGGGKPVFYSYTAPASGTLTLETAAGPGTPILDTLLTVFTDITLSTNSVLASDDDSGPAAYSLINLSVVMGTTYYIAVDGFNGTGGGGSNAESPFWNPDGADSGSFTLTWSLA